MRIQNLRPHVIWCTLRVLFLGFCLSSGDTFAEQFIVRNGEPRAEIVVSPDAVPLVELAAEQLQSDLQKMSGAKLPVVHEPTREDRVQVYVGNSTYTAAQDIDAGNLANGGYHMVSGDGWLALVGRDQRFLDQRHEKAREMLRLARHRPGSEAWDTLWKKWYDMTGKAWGLPYNQYWKMYNEEMDISMLDERGTFNAVVGFLRMQGVRRYSPGPLGLVMPHKKDIPLPDIQKTARPDIPVRRLYLYEGRWHGERKKWDIIQWQLWMGLNPGGDIQGVPYMFHGMSALTETRTERGLFAHPRADEPKPKEFYALFGGKRDIGGNQCLSSEGLFKENVAYARALYDIFDVPMVSVNPSDSYTSICQCEKCRDKADPDRPYRGRLSNYVWDYVNRVAKELYKTHPDRYVVGLSYNTYRLPPTNIETFSPNLVVCITQSRMRFNAKPADFQWNRDIRKGFLDLLPGDAPKLLMDDHYRCKRGVPTYHPRAVAADMQSLQNVCLGDFTEMRFRDIIDLNVYVTGRFWWDADLDIDALLNEYCDRYYGPASEAMKRFITYAEKNWPDMTQSREKIETVQNLIRKAQDKVKPGTIYGKRVARIAGHMEPLAYEGNQLAAERKDAIVQRMVTRSDKTPINIDGKLDDPFWQNFPGEWSGSLKETRTGRSPAFETTFKVAWHRQSIYFGIYCQDLPENTVNNTATKHDQTSIWEGDAVEILLDTQVHSYYQLAISPAGALIDLSHDDGLQFGWESNAQVATHIGEDYWTVEVRIPVAGKDRRKVDPFDGLAGVKPTAASPWYFNVCRQRVRGDDRLNMAFSPTNQGGFQHPEKFAKLIGQ